MPTRPERSCRSTARAAIVVVAGMLLCASPAAAAEAMAAPVQVAGAAHHDRPSDGWAATLPGLLAEHEDEILACEQKTNPVHCFRDLVRDREILIPLGFLIGMYEKFKNHGGWPLTDSV